MATRMQQRRGTAAQWISTNSGNGPILNAGEIGFETDTNKFKIGDGTNHWINLDYFIDANSTVNPAFGSSITFEGATANAFETTIAVTDPTADRTITLPDASGTVVLADGSGNVTVSGDLTVSGTTTTINSTTINATTGIVFEGLTANAFETTLTVEDPTADRTITFPDATGTVALIESVNTSLGGYVETSDIGGVSGVAGLDSSLNLIVPGSSIIIEGTTDNAFETTLTVEDPTADRTLTLPDSNGTLTTQTYVDTLALAHTTATTNVHGILDTNSLATQTYADTAVSTHSQDTTDVHGITNTSLLTTTTNTQTLTNKTLTSPKINEDVVLTATATALNYVAGVTSDVQTQLNNKQAVVANVSDTEIGYLDGVTSAIQTQLNNKQAVVANVSDAEIGYLDGVTSSIQTQLDNKSTASKTETLTNKTLTSPVINTPTGITKTDVGLANVDNTTDANKPVSTAQQTALDLKLALAGGTMTGALTLSADPSSSLHAATKQYVDSLAEGLHVHASVVAATTANVTLSSALENGDTLDGVTLATGNRILVKNQTTKSENGIYIVAASGAPSRAADFDSPGEIDGGDFVFVTGGTTNDNTGWVQTNTVGTIGTDEIEFSQFAGAGVVTAGTNISVTGNQVSVINNPTFSGVVTASASGVAFSDGTQTKEGVPSQTPIIQKTASYTLSALTERDNLIEMGSSSAITLSIPTDATLNFPIGTSLDILQTGTGQVTIAAVTPGTTTVNATPGLNLRTQWSSATLFKRAANTWVVFGDLTA